MLTIFIMYSTDRRSQLENTISCLKDMKYYDQCQKVLVVDGKPNEVFNDFDMISVPRVGGKFSWSNMWAAGVGVSRHPVVLYLDSDRLLPNNYLELVLDNIKDDVFLFTSLHFMVLRDIPVEDCKLFLNSPLDSVLYDDKFVGKLEFEPRFCNPVNGPGKNVMSGNTAFTKKTFLELGGVDPWYCGHGAYADTDFHRQAAKAGCQFVDLKATELHYHHTKLSEHKTELDNNTLFRLGLDNFIYYSVKWGVSLTVAEDLAFGCSIINPQSYVADRVKAIKEIE